MEKMIRVAVLCIALLGWANVSNAQPRAIGGRIGYGVNFSYEHGFGEKNMLEIEAGLPAFHGIEAACTYDWIFPFKSWEHKGEWNWYAGVGAAGGYFWPYYSYGYYYGYYGGYHTGFVGAAGRLGVEYNFWFPLQLSIDWRPVVGAYMHGRYDEYGNRVSGMAARFYTEGLYVGGFALGVRYRF